MKKIHYFYISTLILVLDQATKQYINNNFILHESKKIIDGFFNLTYITNPGIAFGIFSQNRTNLLTMVLTVIMLAAIVFILVLFKNLPENSPFGKISLSLILGGAVGNLIDRIIYKEVIDFLDIYIGQYHWPAFNIADSAISIGMFLFAYHIIMENKGEKNNVPSIT